MLGLTNRATSEFEQEQSLGFTNNSQGRALVRLL